MARRFWVGGMYVPERSTAVLAVPKDRSRCGATATVRNACRILHLPQGNLLHVFLIGDEDSGFQEGIRAAAETYRNALRDHGDPLPVPRRPLARGIG